MTILLPGSPRGGSVAGPSSLPDQRPFISFLKAVLVLFFGGSGWHCHQGGTGGHAGFVIRAVFPEAQQEHGEFAGDGHDGAFLFAGAAGAGQPLAVFAQGAGRAEGTQDVMRGADQQPAQQAVAAFASMRRQSSGKLVAQEFSRRNGGLGQGGKGSRFHPNSLARFTVGSDVLAEGGA